MLRRFADEGLEPNREILRDAHDVVAQPARPLDRHGRTDLGEMTPTGAKVNADRHERRPRSQSEGRGPGGECRGLAEELHLDTVATQVTIGEQSLPLPNPFWVLATQNPIEHEGTYPLPEAQLDRFLMKLTVGYPDRQAEL